MSFSVDDLYSQQVYLYDPLGAGVSTGPKSQNGGQLVVQFEVQFEARLVFFNACKQPGCALIPMSWLYRLDF